MHLLLDSTRRVRTLLSRISSSYLLFFYEKYNPGLVLTKREQNFVASSSTCNYTRNKQVDSRLAVVRFRESFKGSQTKLDPTLTIITTYFKFAKIMFPR